MKPKTVIYIRVIGVTVEGFCVALVAGLAQWATGGESPNPIAWVVIIAAAVAQGFGKLNSFLSTTYAKYLQAGSNTPKEESKP